jgi:HEAT repeat protein
VDKDIQKVFLQVLGAGWQQIPEQIIPILIEKLRSDESDLKNTASNILTKIAQQDLTLIFEKLISQPETESFIRKGMISMTLTQIAKCYPQNTIKLLNQYCLNEDVNICTNSISVLSEIAEIYPDEIDLRPLLNLWIQDVPAKIKKEIAKTVVNIALTKPEKIKPFLPTIIKSLSEPDATVRRTVAKLFIDLAEKTPDFVPLSAIKVMLKDEEPAIRENAMQLIGIAGFRFPQESLQFLLAGLKDHDWNVKNAAASAIGEISSKVDNIELLNEVKNMLNDPEKWTRLKAIEVIQKALDRNISILSLKEVLALFDKPDQEEVFLANLSKVLGQIGSEDFKKSFPYMVKMLGHSSEKVRDGMISGMVKLSGSGLIPITTIIPNLLKYLSDETDIILQQSIAILLKRIVRYEGDEIKNRVISLLKIRCQMSQDSIICEALSDLQKV